VSGDAPDTHLVEVTVNGRRHRLPVPGWRTLSDLLRRDFGLTGTTLGCQEGECGSCTVLVDGQPARSCLTLAVQVADRRVETVESLDADGEPSPLQRAFRAHGALQCGFCTPAFLLLGTALLRQDPAPSATCTRRWLDAALCRCTGYQGIVDAVQAVAAGEITGEQP
jgi:aerobic-type carbon monoxide dehydrogenase small subunit (CoxS/CutS family)